MQTDPLVPVPVIVAGAGVLAATLLTRVARARSVRAGITPALVRAVVMAMTALAVVTDPWVNGGHSEAQRVSADVVFVVDSTSSMAAVDYHEGLPRLEGVRADILELAESFRGAHFSLIRFDSQARLELPWTTDVSALETAVSVIRQERAVYSQGSSLELPAEVLDYLIPRPGSAPSTSTGEDGSFVVVFYFSDGERRPGPTGDRPRLDTQTGMIIDNGGTGVPEVSFADLASDIDRGAVFGYGTPEGAPMIEFRGTDEPFTGASPYVFDYSAGVLAISRLDEGNLVEIAEELGLPYIHRSEPGGLGGLAAQFASDAPMVSDGSRDTRLRLYWIPALVLVALVLWQAAVSVSEARDTRRLFGGPARPAGATAATTERSHAAANGGKEHAA